MNTDGPVLVAWITVVVVAIGVAGWFWRRSRRSAIRRLVRQLLSTSPEEMPVFFDRELAYCFPPEQGPDALDEVARRLEVDARHPELAEMVRGAAAEWRAIRSMADPPDRDDRIALADALETQAYALAAYARRFVAIEHVAHTFALQSWFFAAILRAESANHLAALAEDLEELDLWVDRAGKIPEAITRIYDDLRAVIRAHGQLSRLPAAEDRALFLGQALGRILGAQEHLARHRAAGPSFAAMVIDRVLESVRSQVATALSDIRQRAQLSAVLRTRALTTSRQAVLVLDLRNDGHGHAENILVELRGVGDSLRLLEPRQALRRLLRDQTARLEFPVEPRSSDRVRVSIRITYDDLERNSQSHEQADVVELRGERRDEAFRALRPNPYVVGRPLTEDDVFIGRADLFERLDACLQGAHQDNIVVLIGQRRMGKTSILRRLRRHLHRDYLPILIDLQGMLGSGEATFFHEIATTVFDALEVEGIALDEPRLDDFVANPGAAFRRRFLRAVRRAIGDRRLLLVFDELEVLEERIAGGEIDRKVLPYFRSLMQHEPWVSFMFAGTHRLEELTGDYWGVLFNLAVYFQVGHLPRGEVDRLFVEPTREVFDIDPLALDKAYRITGGHPHFSQLLARELVELRNREHLMYVTIREINRVAERVVDTGQLHIGYLWAEATRGERFLLLALITLLDEDGTATVSAAHAHLAERRIEPGDLPASARALVRRQILDDRGGQLSFRMELFRQWIERHRDLESMVLSELGGASEAGLA